MKVRQIFYVEKDTIEKVKTKVNSDPDCTSLSDLIRQLLETYLEKDK